MSFLYDDERNCTLPISLRRLMGFTAVKRDFITFPYNNKYGFGKSAKTLKFAISCMDGGFSMGDISDSQLNSDIAYFCDQGWLRIKKGYRKITTYELEYLAPSLKDLKQQINNFLTDNPIEGFTVFDYAKQIVGGKEFDFDKY